MVLVALFSLLTAGASPKATCFALTGEALSAALSTSPRSSAEKVFGQMFLAHDARFFGVT